MSKKLLPLRASEPPKTSNALFTARCAALMGCGPDSTGQHRAGQDRTAKDRTGQHSTGQDRIG